MTVIPDHDFIPFGFQYYRAPTPARSEWENDLRTISENGFNTVKFWVQWRGSHPQPDVFHFDDIDQLMDLAEKYQLKVVLNLIFDIAPAWIYLRYPDARMITAEGIALGPTATPCRQLGGAPGPCYHHDQANDWKDRFLAETVMRYQDHPALLYWDLWNEPELTTGLKRAASFANQVCYCANSVRAFRNWLKAQYGSLAQLNARWLREYRAWDEIEPPIVQGIFNDFRDWRQFFIDTMTAELARRVKISKRFDQRHPVMCHTVPFPIFNAVTCASDEFSLARHCDLFGNSLGSSAWSADLTMSAARGKTVINSEIHALPGSTALRPKKLSEQELLKMIMIPLSKGIKGFLFWQYRPETLGLEAPAWGASAMDGADTPWLRQTAALNQMIQKNRNWLSAARSESDGLAILYNIDTQLASFAIYESNDIYAQSLQGTHELLYDLNYSVEFIHQGDVTLDRLSEIRCLWLPFPIYMSNQLCSVLRRWVADGGVLISECCLAALQAENGLYSQIIPGYGLDQVFGIRESWTDSIARMDNSYQQTQSSLTQSQININSCLDDSETMRLGGSYFRSTLELDAGTQVAARFKDGSPAITCRRFGQGQAVYIGSLTSPCYHEERPLPMKHFFAKLLDDCGIRPALQAEGEGVRADILINPARKNQALLFVHNQLTKPQQSQITWYNRSITDCLPMLHKNTVQIINGKLILSLGADDINMYQLTIAE